MTGLDYEIWCHEQGMDPNDEFAFETYLRSGEYRQAFKEWRDSREIGPFFPESAPTEKIIRMLCDEALDAREEKIKQMQEELDNVKE
jgi:hypothetical protein